MIIVPGRPGKDLCDSSLGMTRRDILRVGGSGLLGISLGSLLQLQRGLGRRRVGPRVAPPGLGQGQGDHHALPPGRAEPPRPLGPQGGRARQRPERLQGDRHARSPASSSPRSCPSCSKLTDKLTLIRSMSYTPNGLFNHTAAIYQMMTGYTTDKVSPSGQLEPPSPKDFPNFGSNIIRLKPQTEPMLPFVMLPRPLQESNVVGKGGTAGFLGKAFDPYTLYPDGDDLDNGQDEPDPGRRPPTPPRGLLGPPRAPGPAPRRDQRRDAGDRQGRVRLQPQRILRPGAQADRLRAGPARRSTSSASRRPPATSTAGTPSARAACWPAAWSRPAPRSSR